METSDIILQNNHPLLSEACKLEGVNKFGSGPSLKSKDYKIIFVVYPESLTRSDNTSPNYDCDVLVGDCLFYLSGRYLKMQHSYFVGAEVLRNSDPCRPAIEIEDHLVTKIDLRAKYLFPRDFDVRTPYILARPKTFLRSSLCFYLGFCSGPFNFKKEACAFRILRVKVEMYEVRSCIDTSRGRLDSKSLIRGVRKITLSDFRCLVIVRVPFGNDWCCEIPPQLYNCRLPCIGPTFSSGRMTRSYVLKVSVTLRCQYGTFYSTLSDFYDISIAKEVSGRDKVSSPHKDYKNVTNCLFLSLCIPYKLYRPAEVASQVLSTVSLFAKDAYEMHETRAIKCSDKIFTATSCSMKKPDRQAEHEKIVRLEEASACRNQGNDTVLRYEIAGSTVHSLRWFEGGLRFLTSSWISSSVLRPILDNQADRYANITLSPVPMGLLMSFNLVTFYNRTVDDNIVMPGMKLLEFAKLQLLLPGLELSQELQIYDICIQNFCVSIDEICAINSIPNKPPSVTSREICNKRHEYRIKWKQAGESLLHTPKLFALTIPARLYDCKIPKLEPTFYSNESSRVYRLKVELKLKKGDSYETLVVGMPINIAADLTGYRWWGGLFSLRKRRQAQCRDREREFMITL